MLLINVTDKPFESSAAAAAASNQSGWLTISRDKYREGEGGDVWLNTIQKF